ncbi:hypothetical protein OROGR_000657 [Orobanche gracilis]
MPPTIEATLLSVILKALFEKLVVKTVLDFFQNRPDKVLDKLKENLLSLRTVVDDAEEKQFLDSHVREWVDNLKDATYDADDIIDAVTTKQSQPRNILEQVRDNASSLNPFTENIVKQLKLINERLKCLIDHKDVLGLRGGGGVGKLFPLSFPTTSLVDENVVYGRDDDRNKIKEFLFTENDRNEKGVPVIAIVGMAGVGKTTLAQLLFNDVKVRERFSLRLWAHVSGGLDVYETTKRIHGLVLGFKHSDIPDLNFLQLDLQHWLARKSVLLILDDFWNDNIFDWDVFKRPLESANCNSRIIVTTRNQNVALALRADHIYSLPHLSEEHSWKLFSSHAFKSGNPDKHPALKEIGDKIAKKCKGLPLATKTLGSLLRFKEDPDEWRNILNSQIWELPSDKSYILPALRLSYIHLPSHLKRCFAYCSVFPKGLKIEKWRLICLWMAEGILPQHRTNKRAEDVGAECFQELLSRSFFQLDDQGTSFEIHDLVSDLAHYVAGGFCSDLEDIKSRKTGVKPRHIFYSTTWDDGQKRFEGLRDEYRKILRTFLPFKDGLSTFTKKSVIAESFVQKLMSFTRLRVLSLSNYGITSMPESIKELQHLRYLDLSKTKIIKLSPSVSKLYNLETLLLSNCLALEKLPDDMFCIVKLRYLDISGCKKLKKLPVQFGKLQELQVFRGFFPRAESDTGVSELGKLTQLHSLVMVKVENVVDAQHASEACLGSKKCLRELELEWTHTLDQDHARSHRATTVLDKLQPHNNLTSLKITEFCGDKLPNWMGSSLLSGLVFLQLGNCHSCPYLPSLGQLPSLIELHILNMQCLEKVGPEFCGTQGLPFLSLQILKFENMPNWKDWSPNDNSQGHEVLFASLRVFSIKNCPMLVGDVSQFPKDNRLHVSDSPTLQDLLENRSRIP